MIVGIGTDLIEISRVEAVYGRHGERFLQRILTKPEQEVALHKKSITNYLAKQFSVKEAIAKALGTGIGRVSFQDIEVLRDELGKPVARLLHQSSKDFPGLSIHVSLTDSITTVMAFCVIEKK